VRRGRLEGSRPELLVFKDPFRNLTLSSVPLNMIINNGAYSRGDGGDCGVNTCGTGLGWVQLFNFCAALASGSAVLG
jgi:hypothetical protein